MDFNLSFPLADALKTIEQIGAGALDDEKAGAASLASICEFIPERAEDADALLEVARGMLPPESVAAGPIIEAQMGVLSGDVPRALDNLSEAVEVARAEGHALTERLCLNVISGPVPAVAALRPALPWEGASLRRAYNLMLAENADDETIDAYLDSQRRRPTNNALEIVHRLNWIRHEENFSNNFFDRLPDEIGDVLAAKTSSAIGEAIIALRRRAPDAAAKLHALGAIYCQGNLKLWLDVLSKTGPVLAPI